MHARVTTGQVQPEKIDEIKGMYERDILPAQRQAGLKGSLILMDRATEQFLSVSLWESAEAVTASQSVYQDALAKLAGFLTGPTSRQDYEVLVQV